MRLCKHISGISQCEEFCINRQLVPRGTVAGVVASILKKRKMGEYDDGFRGFVNCGLWLPINTMDIYCSM